MGGDYPEHVSYEGIQTVKFDAIGLGLCAWDRILLFERYPGANQKVEVISSTASGGGPVPTALAAFSKLGGKAAFLGVVGDDLEGDLVRQDLRRFGVDTTHLISRPKCKTPCAYIWVDRESGDRTVALDPGTVDFLKPGQLPESLIRQIPFLLIDGRHGEPCLAAARLCREGGGTVILDAGSPRQRIHDLLAFTDHAVVSQDFVAGTFPGTDFDGALSKIGALGPKSVVITCGAEGGYWWENSASGRYGAFLVPVLDTTGAGDAFHGGYLFALKSGDSIQRRCDFASAAAALACRALGGRAALANYQDVISLLGK